MVYGLIVLVPLTVLVILLAKLVEILETIAKSLGFESIWGAGIMIILALLLLIGVCYLLGAAVNTRIGSLSMAKVEERVLKQIPGYAILKNIINGFTGQKITFPAAMIRLFGPGTAVLGFVMEENPNGMLTVFVPSSPAFTVGQVHLVERERVTVLESGALELIDGVSQWGVGSGKVLGEPPA